MKAVRAAANSAGFSTFGTCPQRGITTDSAPGISRAQAAA
jgi:hypothetical protein